MGAGVYGCLFVLSEVDGGLFRFALVILFGVYVVTVMWLL